MWDESHTSFSDLMYIFQPGFSLNTIKSTSVFLRKCSWTLSLWVLLLSLVEIHFNNDINA